MALEKFAYDFSFENLVQFLRIVQNYTRRYNDQYETLSDQTTALQPNQ